MSKRRLNLALLAAILVAHAGLLLVSIRRNFVVLDEAGHIPAGIAHWQTGSFSVYRVNPPLPRMLAALPALAARPKTEYRRLSEVAGIRTEFALGSDFARRNAGRYLDIVRLARLPGVAWSLLGAFLVWRWARDLYGDGAGLLGAAIWCFEPTILTFAAVVTPDLPATVAGLAATYVYWGWLRRPTTRRAWLAGLLLGVAQLTKFTMLILYGVWPLLWLVHRSSTPGKMLAPRDLLRQASVMALASLVVVNAGYVFRETGIPLGDYSFVSRMLGGDPLNGQASFQDGLSGNRFRGTWIGAVPVPVPADYLRGIDVQRRDFEGGYPSYLAGRWLHHGWWYYYLYALSVKEPIGLIVMVLWGLALVAVGHRACAPIRAEWTLLIPVLLILIFVSSQTGFSHHMRYILPIFPFLIIGAAKLAHFVSAVTRPAGFLLSLLIVWSLTSVLSPFPHTMSYFNEIAGGPDHGADHLLDSNMDWGQDLTFLKEWLDRHPEARLLALAYFNVIDPAVAGIDYRLPPPGPNGLFTKDRDYQAAFGPQPGYYAISVSYLRGSTFPVPDGNGGFRRVSRGDYEYFRRFRPIAKAGYSILIYHITPAQAAAERRRLGRPPLR
jgi:hypothetical protein